MMHRFYMRHTFEHANLYVSIRVLMAKEQGFDQGDVGGECGLSLFGV